jgi:GAF domain-containing protein
MRGQTLTDTQLLLELVGEAYSFEDLTQFRSGVLDVLGRVVPSDRVAYNEIAPDESFALMIPEFDASLMPTFTALSHENPLISRYQRTGDGRPYRISDMIDQKTFHETTLYKEFYRQMGVESQVAFSLPSRPQLLVGLALTREREDFSDHEVQLLALARPHLMQAYRNAELRGARAAMLAALEEGLDTSWCSTGTGEWSSPPTAPGAFWGSRSSCAVGCRKRRAHGSRSSAAPVRPRRRTCCRRAREACSCGSCLAGAMIAVRCCCWKAGRES